MQKTARGAAKRRDAARCYPTVTGFCMSWNAASPVLVAPTSTTRYTVCCIATGVDVHEGCYRSLVRMVGAGLAGP